MYRLRQLALVARSLEPAASQLCRTLGTHVVFRDPAVAAFGLENVVVPVGGDFLEIVVPTTPTASAGRYLEKVGPGGYMVILECADAFAAGARATARGRREVYRIDRPDYRSVHFHPSDFGGVILSVDTTGAADFAARFARWPPAGPTWRKEADAADLEGLVRATLTVSDPLSEGERWAQALGLTLSAEVRDSARLNLGIGEIVFTPLKPGGRAGLAGLTIKAKAPAAVMARAQADGLALEPDGFHLAGVRFALA